MSGTVVVPEKIPRENPINNDSLKIDEPVATDMLLGTLPVLELLVKAPMTMEYLLINARDWPITLQ